MIYDQALTIELDQGGPVERITANFKHTVKNSVSPSDWADLQTGDYSKFDSICNQTMVGFWQTDGPAISCVIGRQIDASDDIVIDAAKTDYKQAFFKV